MKKIIVTLVVFALITGSHPLFAAGPKEKTMMRVKGGKSAESEAIFHRITDWFATRGKSPEEVEEILAARKAERAAERARREVEKKKKEMEKEMIKRHEKVRKNMQKREKELKRRMKK